MIFLCEVLNKKEPEFPALSFWRWREALALGAMPLVCRAGGLARFHCVQQRAQLDSLTQGKLLPCSPPIKKARY